MQRQKRRISDITDIVLHHSASRDEYSTHETLDAHLRATNLGYHVSVDDDAVFKSKAAGHDGKATFKQHVPDDEVVWGAAGCNFHGWHLSFDGNSDTMPPTHDEVETAIQIIAAKCRKFGWNKAYARKHIITHQYVGRFISVTKYGTACPGAGVKAVLAYIIDRVCSYLPD